MIRFEDSSRFVMFVAPNLYPSFRHGLNAYRLIHCLAVFVVYVLFLLRFTEVKSGITPSIGRRYSLFHFPQGSWNVVSICSSIKAIPTPTNDPRIPAIAVLRKFSWF